MLGQDFGEAPDFVKSIVKRGGGDANDIWFAEIADHAGSFQFIE